jgi:chromosome segregation ATPase
MWNDKKTSNDQNRVMITTSVSPVLKAKIEAEAKENEMNISKYVAHVLGMYEENQNLVLELRQTIRELESDLQGFKKKPKAIEPDMVEAIVGISDMLNEVRTLQKEMQEQVSYLYLNQPSDLQERIEELEQELEEIREEQMSAEDEEETEGEEAEQAYDEEADKGTWEETYRKITRDLRLQIIDLEKSKETDCIKFQRAGEKAMAKIAMHQFGQVVDLVAKDYTFSKSIKKKMWAVFRGMPKRGEAWDLVENPYSVVKVETKR